MAAPRDSIRAESKLKVVKWKVRKESHVYKGTVLAQYCELDGDKLKETKKLKASRAGIVADISVQEGNVANLGDILLVMCSPGDQTCSHPTIMKDMCAECGMDLRENLGLPGDRKTSTSASVAMVHSIPELIVSQEQAMEIGKEDENRLLKQRKLVLLVDLDQTLIHTTNDNIPPNLKDVKHFQLWHGRSFMWYHTRFRPFTLRFIEAVSKMYELHICTFGVRMYAHIIARLLDPDEKYFSHRILSRDECFDAMSKTANLKALFPRGDKTVCIIDDREDVWNFAPNLVHVKPYRFFQGTADINAPPGLTKKEHDSEPLAHKVVDPSQDKAEQDNPSAAATAGSDAAVENSKGNRVVERTAATRLTGDFESQTDLKDKPEENSSANDAQSLSDDCDNGVKGVDAGGDSQTGDCVDNKVCPMEGDQIPSQGDPETTKATSVYNQEKGTNSEDSKGQNDSLKVNKDELAGAKVDDADAPKEIDWDDTDDYLLHLEEILTRIHTAFYDMYEQSQKRGSAELPDLKSIVPYVRKKVLKGANVVFSGMVPLNMPVEKSRAYIVATALGATIHTDIVLSKTKGGKDPSATTHLVAAKAGTGKHKSALKVKGLHIVCGDWLWACSERWEWVVEGLYPLASQDMNSKTESSAEEKDSLGKKMSHKRLHGKRETAEPGTKILRNEEANDEAAAKRQKLNVSSLESGSNLDESPSTEASINPLHTLSDEELSSMDKEVDLLLEGEDDDSSDETDDERDKRMRKNVLGSGDESDSDSDSLSGDFPRGWKLRRKSSQSPETKDILKVKDDRSDAEEDDETENELEKYEKNISAFSPNESSSSDSAESIGSVNDEIAEALEKEFLASS